VVCLMIRNTDISNEIAMPSSIPRPTVQQKVIASRKSSFFARIFHKKKISSRQKEKI
jgi:hypothetical protein